MRICASSGCPDPSVDGGRGHCAAHRRTTSERGYGAAWQAESLALRVGAVCERCGTAEDLTADHDRHRKRVLCRSCHATVGVRDNANGGWNAGDQRAGGGVETMSLARAVPDLRPSFRGLRNSGAARPPVIA